VAFGSIAEIQRCGAVARDRLFIFTLYLPSPTLSYRLDLHDGAFSFDGNGTFTGKQTSVSDRNFAQRETLHGTCALDADSTWVMMMEGQRGGIAHWDIFVTEDGKKGRMIRTDAGTTAVRTFEQ
jgi:hypothetical protein